uniref:Uncharacterized protein n=1 Tax=Romanomermis culicivorax TaxID=13658 RepID=A0A915KVB1_ROMCU
MNSLDLFQIIRAQSCHCMNVVGSSRQGLASQDQNLMLFFVSQCQRVANPIQVLLRGWWAIRPPRAARHNFSKTDQGCDMLNNMP